MVNYLRAHLCTKVGTHTSCGLQGLVESKASGCGIRISVPGWGWGTMVGKLGSPVLSQRQVQEKEQAGP